MAVTSISNNIFVITNGGTISIPLGIESDWKVYDSTGAAVDDAVFTEVQENVSFSVTDSSATPAATLIVRRETPAESGVVIPSTVLPAKLSENQGTILTRIERLSAAIQDLQKEMDYKVGVTRSTGANAPLPSPGPLVDDSTKKRPTLLDGSLAWEEDSDIVIQAELTEKDTALRALIAAANRELAALRSIPEILHFTLWRSAATPPTPPEGATFTAPVADGQPHEGEYGSDESGYYDVSALDYTFDGWSSSVGDVGDGEEQYHVNVTVLIYHRAAGDGTWTYEVQIRSTAALEAGDFIEVSVETLNERVAEATTALVNTVSAIRDSIYNDPDDTTYQAPNLVKGAGDLQDKYVDRNDSDQDATGLLPDVLKLHNSVVDMAEDVKDAEDRVLINRNVTASDRERAEHWATRDEDVPVDGTEGPPDTRRYSSKHWAAKSEGSASAAAGSATNADTSAKSVVTTHMAFYRDNATPPNPPDEDQRTRTFNRNSRSVSIALGSGTGTATSSIPSGTGRLYAMIFRVPADTSLDDDDMGNVRIVDFTAFPVSSPGAPGTKGDDGDDGISTGVAFHRDARDISLPSSSGRTYRRSDGALSVNLQVGSAVDSATTTFTRAVPSGNDRLYAIFFTYPVDTSGDQVAGRASATLGGLIPLQGRDGNDGDATPALVALRDSIYDNDPSSDTWVAPPSFDTDDDGYVAGIPSTATGIYSEMAAIHDSVVDLESDTLDSHDDAADSARAAGASARNAKTSETNAATSATNADTSAKSVVTTHMAFYRDNATPANPPAGDQNSRTFNRGNGSVSIALGSGTGTATSSIPSGTGRLYAMIFNVPVDTSRDVSGSVTLNDFNTFPVSSPGAPGTKGDDGPSIYPFYFIGPKIGTTQHSIAITSVGIADTSSMTSASGAIAIVDLEVSINGTAAGDLTGFMDDYATVNATLIPPARSDYDEDTQSVYVVLGEMEGSVVDRGESVTIRGAYPAPLDGDPGDDGLSFGRGFFLLISTHPTQRGAPATLVGTTGTLNNTTGILTFTTRSGTQEINTIAGPRPTGTPGPRDRFYAVDYQYDASRTTGTQTVTILGLYETGKGADGEDGDATPALVALRDSIYDNNPSSDTWVAPPAFDTDDDGYVDGLPSTATGIYSEMTALHDSVVDLEDGARVFSGSARDSASAANTSAGASATSATNAATSETNAADSALSARGVLTSVGVVRDEVNTDLAALRGLIGDDAVAIAESPYYFPPIVERSARVHHEAASQATADLLEVTGTGTEDGDGNAIIDFVLGDGTHDGEYSIPTGVIPGRIITNRYFGNIVLKTRDSNSGGRDRNRLLQAVFSYHVHLANDIEFDVIFTAPFRIGQSGGEVYRFSAKLLEDTDMYPEMGFTPVITNSSPATIGGTTYTAGDTYELTAEDYAAEIRIDGRVFLRIHPDDGGNSLRFTSITFEPIKTIIYQLRDTFRTVETAEVVAEACAVPKDSAEHESQGGDVQGTIETKDVTVGGNVTGTVAVATTTSLEQLSNIVGSFPDNTISLIERHVAHSAIPTVLQRLLASTSEGTGLTCVAFGAQFTFAFSLTASSDVTVTAILTVEGVENTNSVALTASTKRSWAFNNIKCAVNDEIFLSIRTPGGFTGTVVVTDVSINMSGVVIAASSTATPNLSVAGGTVKEVIKVCPGVLQVPVGSHINHFNSLPTGSVLSNLPDGSLINVHGTWYIVSTHTQAHITTIRIGRYHRIFDNTDFYGYYTSSSGVLPGFGSAVSNPDNAFDGAGQYTDHNGILFEFVAIKRADYRRTKGGNEADGDQVTFRWQTSGGTPTSTILTYDSVEDYSRNGIDFIFFKRRLISNEAPAFRDLEGTLIFIDVGLTVSGTYTPLYVTPTTKILTALHDRQTLDNAQKLDAVRQKINQILQAADDASSNDDLRGRLQGLLALDF